MAIVHARLLSRISSAAVTDLDERLLIPVVNWGASYSLPHGKDRSKMDKHPSLTRYGARSLLMDVSQKPQGHAAG